MKRVCWAILLLLACSASNGGTLAQGVADTGRCRPIKFELGATAAVITAATKAEARDRSVNPLCYTLATSDGQRAKVRLISGKNVAITIVGVGDAKDTFDFVTRDGRYELRVFTIFPTGKSAPFQMHVEVSPDPFPRQTTPIEGPGAGDLVGRWLGLQRGVSFPLSCDSGEPVSYGRDGKYAAEGVVGTWRLQGGRLTETATQVQDPGQQSPAKRPYVSRIAWDGPNRFVKTFPNGRRMTFRRCP